MPTIAALASTSARFAAIALVIALPLLVAPWGMDASAYTAVKALLTHALATIALLGWLVSYLAARKPRWQASLPELALWGFLLAVLLSSVTSVSGLLTFFGAPLRYEGLLTVAAYVALYLVGAHFFSSPRGSTTLVVSAAGGATIVIAYGALQPFVPPLFPAEGFMRAWYGGLGIPRIVSTVGGPVVFGGYLTLVLPMIFALAAIARGRLRLFWLLVGSVGVIDLALTLTRAAWLATLVSLVILGAAGWGELRRQRMVVVTMLVAVLMAIVAATTVVGTPAQIASRVVSVTATESGSLAQRLYIWQRTWDLIGQRPWLGWGLETLGEIFSYDRETLVKYFGLRPVIVDRAHNEILQVAVSVGLPGAMAYLAFWLLVVVAAVRVWRRAVGSERLLAGAWLAAVVGYLVQIQFSFSTVALAPIVWLLAGSVAGWEAGTRADPTMMSDDHGGRVDEIQIIVDFARAVDRSEAPVVQHLDSRESVQRYRQKADEIRRVAGAGAHILDWGCLYGQMTFLLERRGLRVVPFDIVQSLRQSTLCPLVGLNPVYSDDPVTLPFEGGSFDAVLSCGTLEHVADPNASLEEIQRILRPNGWLFVYNLPNRLSWTEFLGRLRGTAHERTYRLGEATRWLSNHGFTVFGARYENVMPYTFKGIPEPCRMALRAANSVLARLDPVLERLPPVAWFAANLTLICRKETDCP